MNKIQTAPAAGKATAVGAVDRVAAGLTERIVAELSPGAQLPSEAELALAFGVSRLTIREAIRLLAGRGLLGVARGRRAVVREPDGAMFGSFLATALKLDAKGLFDLIEVRQALEVQSANLAAKRANRAGLAAIENAIDGMQGAAAVIRRGADAAAAAAEDFDRYDVGFHEAVALASGNRMLAFLLEAMAEPLRHSFRLSVRGRQLSGRPLEQTIDAHQQIFERIRHGDSRGAAQAMRAHLRDAEQDIRAALNPPTS
jgi:GntR family transcriptional regulator, transcriptional repressor for pyruvate dehydrogenase complex